VTKIDPNGTMMFAEASEAADVVARQLDANAELIGHLAARLRTNRPRTVVTYARGSSDHAATFAKYVIETRVGVLTSSGAPSIASVYRDPPDFRETLALIVSQSGQSPDILAAVEAANAGGALSVALVNAERSRLEAVADVTIPLRAAPFKLRQAFECDWSPLVESLKRARGLYVIGRGPGLGVAQEAALKLKETCRIHAEAFSSAEVRHGPMELIGPDFPMLVFRQSDESAEGICELARDVIARGAPVFVAGAEVEGATSLPVPDAPELIEPLLHIQALYRAANQLSVELGLDPDRPLHLRKVTETL
jgi:glucosamine--fructose-6-phosphate aminotransferase (isomerizing)